LCFVKLQRRLKEPARRRQEHSFFSDNETLTPDDIDFSAFIVILICEFLAFLARVSEEPRSKLRGIFHP
jgi:hypothetical protein